MESQDFNKWLVKDLLEYLAQYNVDKTDIQGTGKNNNVVKHDLVRAARKVTKMYPSNINNYDIIPKDVVQHILSNLPIQTSRLINKQTLLESKNRYVKNNYVFLSEPGKTPNLKPGDFVLYRGPEYNNDMIAMVIKVTSSTKAQIKPLEYYNNMFNPNSIINIYRKNMTIIKISLDYFRSLPEKIQMYILDVNPKTVDRIE